MRQSKTTIPMFDSAKDEQREARQVALEYLAEAWNTAEDDGVESLALAHASLFAAIATLVRAHGEEATALLVAGLPDRIRGGEYNLERQTH
jgi:broad specificity phosphatase PhoE